MGNAESMPVVSQLKSAVQAAQGDLAGAEETQQRFIRQCPVVSQVTSAVQASMGDLRAAEDTQRQFAANLPDLGDVQAVPVVSQVKSAVQAAQGDLAGAEETQQRFIRQCPVVSQVTSAVQASMGDLRAAEDTQRQFVKHLPQTVTALEGTFMAAFMAADIRKCVARGTLLLSYPKGGVQKGIRALEILAASGAQHPACFLAETLVKSADGNWVQVKDLKRGDHVLSVAGIFVEVRSTTTHPPEFRKLVELRTVDASLKVTASHRVLVWKTDRFEAVPAEALRCRDAVRCTCSGSLETAMLTDKQTTQEFAEVYEISFSPDDEIDAFNMLVPDSRIVSKGHKKRTRRGMLDKPSIPGTDSSAEEH
ncbi:unnamed protein product [Polarella glacialis]|uniref:Hint domain-containing protein n=1 Tax=Polarella glacialis TaxID=89957 RepID=A0A813IDL4_POLGL|nr:unnamed protein product [Polarella glacialis]